MLQPVGSLPPAVYWRRRLVVLVLALVLLMLLVWALGSGARRPATASTTGGPSAAPPPVGGTTTSTTAQVTAPSRTPSSSPSGSAIRTCALDELQVKAATGKHSYAVNSRPDLYLVVTNLAAKPCRYNLADKQIELRIFTGDVRVWGSHDCQIAPGTDVATLPPNKAVRRGIVWSGQTSVPGCTGTRLVAQAGTYTLVARLSGKESPPAAFQLTG